KLVSRMLAPNPHERPQRGQEIVTELNEITRKFGISTSAQGVTDLLSNMFPITGTPLEDDNDVQVVKEIIRVRPEEPATPRTTSQPYSPSITPSAQTAYRLSEVSQTFHRTPSGSVLPRRPTPTKHPPAPRRASRVRFRFILALMLALALSLG